jgi:16S rRNA (cytosine967-C5)-methyltransferase
MRTRQGEVYATWFGMLGGMSPARVVAFRVLQRVEEGGFASDLLRGLSTELSTRDAGLASEIVFGCLRFQGQLDFLIAHFSRRAVAGLDAEVRIALRMGVYQLRYLDRVPAHAAASESVDLVKQAGKRSAAGFVNAVLRKAGGEPVAWPDRATALSLPSWLLDRWDRQFGAEKAGKIAEAFLLAPEKYLRVSMGEARVQDIGSQSIVPLLDLRPGLSFLDLCAAPGNKTAQALESGVRAVACDVSLRRLTGLKLLGCPLVVLDGAAALPFSRPFDRILVDAPCSGTGTLGRNPEIKWRLRPENLEVFHRKQVQLLANALKLLASGGRLVYATCSLEREENESVVEEVLGAVPAAVRRVPGVDAGDGFFAAMIGSA